MIDINPMEANGYPKDNMKRERGKEGMLLEYICIRVLLN
jgi:hypothetical protein